MDNTKKVYMLSQRRGETMRSEEVIYPSEIYSECNSSRTIYH
jgi:hypothetical protein